MTLVRDLDVDYIEFPEDYIGKLMFYLNCCSSCLCYDYQFEEYLINYKNKENYITYESNILDFISLYSSSTVIGCLFYIVKDDSPLLKNSLLYFYEINNATKVLNKPVEIDHFISINSNEIQLTHIMITTQQWIDEFYHKPLTLVKSKKKKFKPAQIHLQKDDLTSKSNLWLSDDKVNKCMKCCLIFSTFHRRHHCRCCGKIFCKECCPKYTYYSSENIVSRYCKQCLEKGVSL